MAEVRLPQLGESVTEGVVTRWLVAVGDAVTADQAIVEISTDKVDTEIPSPVAGIVAELRAAVDDTVEVGAVLAVVSEDAGAAPTPSAAAVSGTPAEPTTTLPAPAPPAATTPAAQPSGATVLAAPLVRRMLADAGLAPADVPGTGPGGRVTRTDAQRAIAAGPLPPARPPAAPAATAPGRPPSAVAPVTTAAPLAVRTTTGERPSASPLRIDFAGQRDVVEPLGRIRRVIAASMHASLQTTAQLTAAVEVDVSRVMQLRERSKDAFKAAHGVSLSPFALVARAVCRVLPRHPALNASIDTDAGTVTYHGFINLGIAVDTERGLLVPNVKDAQQHGVAGLATEIADLAARSRDRRLGPDDIAGGTFTLTNTGSRGTLFDTPILNPPEAAILAVCAIERRPVVVDDGLGESIAIRSMSYLCLTYDHRLVDGADAARFLTDLKWELEQEDLSAELDVPA